MVQIKEIETPAAAPNQVGGGAAGAIDHLHKLRTDTTWHAQFDDELNKALDAGGAEPLRKLVRILKKSLKDGVIPYSKDRSMKSPSRTRHAASSEAANCLSDQSPSSAAN